jgi:aryl-alcohol dehydrogenase-like predicted oxidoreductase
MHLRRLGGAGPTVSMLGLGTNNFGWRIGFEEAREVVAAALDCGITLFDTADVYGANESERFLGELLRGRRGDVVLLTKFGSTLSGGPDVPRGSREYIRWSIEGSLQRLRTDYVDVYMYHRPDGVTAIAETLGALGELVDEGKVQAAAVSNMEAAGVEKACAAARELGVPLCCLENPYSLIRRAADAEIVPACLRNGLALLPYYPLESGLLAGRYRRHEPPPADSRLGSATQLWPAERFLGDEAFDRVERLERFAADRGYTLLEVALAGLAAHPAVGPVITGASRPEHIRANAQAIGRQISQRDLIELEAIGASNHSA